jgi:hypothetical protein
MILGKFSLLQVLLSSFVGDYFGKLESAGFMHFFTEPVCLGCGNQYKLVALHQGWRLARTRNAFALFARALFRKMSHEGGLN